MARPPAKEKPPATGDVALAGPDGARISRLLAAAEKEGTDALAAVCGPAVRRLLSAGPAAAAAGQLFTADELHRLTDVLARVLSGADLLGRFRVRERMRKAAAARGLHTFAEEPFAGLGPVPLVEPRAAIEYFRTLVPRLGVDPVLWAPVMQRTAFTLAAATERSLLEKVRAIILGRLTTGRGFLSAPAEIDDVLTEAGVSPANPQYAQMVFRTNTLEAYNAGLVLEVEQDPEVKGFFPVWQYLGILDGREGDDHRPKFNKYYPNSVPFAVVRGPRVWNCRCTPSYIDRYQWDDLRQRGARVESVW